MDNKIIFRLIEYSSFNTPPALPPPPPPLPFLSLPLHLPLPPPPSSLALALCVKTWETVWTDRQINIARLEFARDGERQLGHEMAEEKQREGVLRDKELEWALERERAREENDGELDKVRSGEGLREREPKGRDGLRELQKVRRGKWEGMSRVAEREQ